MDGWTAGLLIAAVVVLVLVVVLLLMVRGARRTAEKVEAVLAALRDTRDGTAALWQLDATVETADRITDAAARARRSLAPGGAA